jgi:ATP-dependent Clp protease ATP-binding subunit ClpC
VSNESGNPGLGTYDRFTDRARRAVVLAQEEARMLNHDHIGTEHFLLGLIHEGEGRGVKALLSLGISLEAVRQQVEEIIGQGQQAPSGHIPFTPRAKKVLELSLLQALQLGHNYIGTEHILLGLIREGDGVAAQVLIASGADLSKTRQQVIQLLHGYQGKEQAVPAGDSAEPGPPTFVTPDQFRHNLTQDARESKLDPVIGRDKETARVIQVLARFTRNNPVLVGARGAGKTTVVEALAQQVVRGEVPQRMTGKLIYRVNVEGLAEHSASLDRVKRYLREVIEQVRTRGDVILFLDGMRAVPPSVWATLRPMLSRGELQIIGALTQAEYDELLNEHGALERAFVPIQVAEPTVGQTIEILKGLRDRYEAHHRVVFTDGALAAAAEAASRTLPGERLPGKAVDLLDEAASLRRMRVEAVLPPDLREYDEKIAQVREAKESAIHDQDFEKAAALRDAEKQLRAKRATRAKEWKAGEWEVVAEVDEDLIAEALSIMLGLSSDGAADVRASLAPQGPRFAPAAMTAEDREIWGMA